MLPTTKGYESLGDWVKNTRKQKKANSLRRANLKHIPRLDKMGFLWTKEDMDRHLATMDQPCEEAASKKGEKNIARTKKREREEKDDEEEEAGTNTDNKRTRRVSRRGSAKQDDDEPPDSTKNDDESGTAPCQPQSTASQKPSTPGRPLSSLSATCTFHRVVTV